MKLHNKSKMVKGSKHWLLFQFLGNFLTIFSMTCIFTRFFCIYLFTCEKGRGIAGFQDQQNANCQSGPLHLQKIEKRKKSGNEDVFRFSYILLHGYIFLLLFGKKVPNFNQAEKMPLYTPRIIKIMIYVFFLPNL